MPNTPWQRIARNVLSDLGGSLVRELMGGGSRRTDGRQDRGAGGRSSEGRSAGGRSGAPTAGTQAGDYPGDFTGVPSTSYSPTPDGRPDPGEIVWAWVPYEEDHSRGKDRPSLVIGVDGAWLLALPVTSKDHDRDEAQEARAGRYWMDIGTGAWDSRGRPSEVRLNRIVRLDPDRVRREGAALPRDRYDAVIAALR